MTTVAAAENQNNHVPESDRSPRYMHTTVRMADSGLAVGQTRIWTDILLAGFHGSVQVVPVGADNSILANPSPVVVYGVDGKLIGTHDRTNVWSFNFGPDVGAQAKQLKIVHSWDPQWASSIEKTISWVGRGIEILIKALGQAGSKGGVGGDPVSLPTDAAPWAPYPEFTHANGAGGMNT